MSELDELDDLEQQISVLQAKKQEFLDSKRNVVLEEIRNHIRRYGFTAQDLGLGVPLKKPAKAKKPITYLDVANGKEWDGEVGQKGRKPEWIKTRIADGTIEQYRVKH